jgi:membrane fusion protein (multidrug efflux system)
VWTVNNEGKAEFRPITIGEWYGDDIFIDQGLNSGDQVVIDGALSVRQGEPVTAKPLAAATPSAPAGKPAKSGNAKSNRQGR